MHRTIWLYYFVTGLLSLVAGVPVMDNWASELLPYGGSAHCPLEEPLIRMSRGELTICLATWMNGARAIAANGFEVVASAHAGLSLGGWLRVADVLVVSAGILAAVLAVIWLWAHAMTRLAAASMTGTYTLVRAIGLALEPRRG